VNREAEEGADPTALAKENPLSRHGVVSHEKPQCRVQKVAVTLIGLLLEGPVR
jgi:hypothetical protein